MSLMKVKGTSLHSSLTQHLLQGDAHSFWRQGRETFRESLNGLPHWKHQQRWLMTILESQSHAGKWWRTFTQRASSWLFMKSVVFTFSEARKTHTDPDHEEAEAEDAPQACCELHLNWNNITVSLKICQNRNRYLLRFIKCTFARVFVSIKLKSTDDINTINCQHDLWWHLITRQNIKAINRIRLSLVVNKCW